MPLLTKSRFKLALSCPTKLYYNDNRDYENQKTEDKFLEALAEGGYQVGELAKCYYPGGHDITERGYDIPLNRTNELLKLENVIIYEAAIRHNDCFIRVDVLEKKGNSINLIEVKAKSFSGNGTDEFLNNKGFIKGSWNDYLQDVAYQKYVTQKAFPHWNVTAYLMLADKSKTASVNGLNQKFLLKKDEKGNVGVEMVGDTSLEALGNPVLSTVEVDDIANRIINDDIYPEKPEIPYEEKIEQWAHSCTNAQKIISPVGAHCFGCEFQGNDSSKKSGFNECWKHWQGLTDEQLQKPMIGQIWNFKRKPILLKEGIIFIDDVQKEHIGEAKPKKDGTLSNAERQWMQVEKVNDGDDNIYLDADGMRSLMNSFTYPLHFIDFETSMAAIPFYAGQHPYETIAFQFSHHIMHKDGTIEHKDEYIKLERGEFPNFEFIRELKKALETDDGTVFRFAAHENTVLNQIGRQLISSQEPDKDELIEFINSITHNKKQKRKGGPRDMVDMCQMVKDYFYDPRTRGSNSIKAVLPAVLSRSSFLQEKYSKPIYGKNSQIRSKNFDDGWVWIEHDTEGNVKDPYKLLPKLFLDVDPEEVDKFITDDDLNSGGAALTAFAKMQFTEMTETERKEVIQGLLKYCELDTLAMVMIYEYWMHEVGLK
ncbi:MAG: DUF2779 domain-containing protein [Perlabentimonas sp.]